MQPIFHQINCWEGNHPDYRQARAVLRYKPDIIIFEMPQGKRGNPASVFNRYPPEKKPDREIRKIRAALMRASKKFRYAFSDLRTWTNIDQLWKSGHQVLLFNVDAPEDLRYEAFATWKSAYHSAINDWRWWVPLYLRERIMANHIRSILKNQHSKERPIILIFLQSIHWKHVRFLLTDPSEKEIWDYYFGRFPKLNREVLRSKIKKISRIYYKYWIAK